MFTRYGLNDFAQKQGLLALEGAALEVDDRSGEASPPDERAVAFRRRLVELGPAYIKLGQVLSTRPDLLPNEYIRELEHLQDSVEPLPYEDVERIVEAELGARISNYISAVGDTPAGLVLCEMISIGYREGLKLPAELTLLAKAPFSLDAVTTSLDPMFNPSATMRDYASNIANERARRDMSPQRLFQIATDTGDLFSGFTAGSTPSPSVCRAMTSPSGSTLPSCRFCSREWRRSRIES